MLKKGLVAGVYDHLHVGHQFLLAHCVASCDFLQVVVARDANVAKMKHKTPKNDEIVRKKAIQSYLAWYLQGFSVDLGDEEYNPEEMIAKVKPDVLFLGYDQRIDEEKIQKAFPKLEIQRMKPFGEDYFKSSRF